MFISVFCRGSAKTRNVDAGTWNAGTENSERRNRKPGTLEQKTRNAGTENPERWNRKPETPEEKTRNAGTENLERIFNSSYELIRHL